MFFGFQSWTCSDTTSPMRRSSIAPSHTAIRVVLGIAAYMFCSSSAVAGGICACRDLGTAGAFMVTGDLSTAPSATALAYTAFKSWNVFLRGVAPPLKLSRLDNQRLMSSVVIPVRGYFQKSAWER